MARAKGDVTVSIVTNHEGRDRIIIQAQETPSRHALASHYQAGKETTKKRQYGYMSGYGTQIKTRESICTKSTCGRRLELQR
jgi:hypothetical protein